MRHLFLLFCLPSCGILSSGFPRPSLPVAPPSGVVESALAVSDSTLDQIGNFAWLSILLVLFLPGIRKPLVSLWTSIFGAFSVPFMALRKWYEDMDIVKNKSNGE